MVWLPSQHGTFSVKYLYIFLGLLVLCYSWLAFGDLVCLLFSALGASWGKSLLQINLREEVSHWQNRCFICQGEEEVTDHILPYCEKVWALYQLTFTLVVSWVPFHIVRQKLLR